MANRTNTKNRKQSEQYRELLSERDTLRARVSELTSKAEASEVPEVASAGDTPLAPTPSAEVPEVAGAAQGPQP